MADHNVVDASMTTTDIIGTTITIVVFLLMIWIYWYVFRPKSKDLEEGKYLPFDDEQNNDAQFRNDKDG
ncbi:MAG: cbb3-type cytochrome c oxidase subunit 3 [Nitrospinota bacterium]